MTDTPRLFGAQAVVQHANALTQLVEQPNGLQGRYIDRWCRPEGHAVRRLANDGGQHGGSTWRRRRPSRPLVRRGLL